MNLQVIGSVAANKSEVLFSMSKIINRFEGKID